MEEWSAKKIVKGLILDLKEQTTQKQAPGGVGLMKKINSSKRKTKEGGTWGRPHLYWKATNTQPLGGEPSWKV